MATISKSWWEHLAPKPLITRRGEIEALLEDFISSSSFGEDWYNVARNPKGVFRTQPGQYFPTVRIVFLDKEPAFIGPFEKLKPGHRTVVSVGDFASKKGLAEEEHVTKPIISIDLVTDPLFIEAARRGQTTTNEKQVTHPSLLFSVPAHFLLSPKRSPRKAYVLYQHIFGHGGSYPNDGYFYVGVTTRSWQKRWSEHKRAIGSGSTLLFHRKFREETEGGRVHYIHHKVMSITDDLEKLYNAEEFLVEGHWEDQRRLNMIPGGKAGLRYLRENGLIHASVVPMPDERDRILSDWLKHHPRKGLPAPWVSKKWEDDEWAVAQICGRDDRLSAEQVRAIRKLGKNYSAEEIFPRIGARNVAQVKRVLAGKTYLRVD